MKLPWLSLLLAAAAGWGQTPLPAISHDEPYIQEIPTLFGEDDGLPSSEVYTVAVLPNGLVLASTAAGLAVFEDGGWSIVESPDFDVHHILGRGDYVWLGGPGGLGRYTQSTGEWIEMDFPAGAECTALALSPDGETLAVGTLTGVEVYKGLTHAGTEAVPHPVRGIALRSAEEVALATDGGLYLGSSDSDYLTTARQLPADEHDSWSPVDVKALADTGSTLWFGCRNGVGAWDGSSWKLYTGKEGLPYDHFTCAAAGESDNVVWFGTEWGAIRYDGTRWDYRGQDRWIPAEPMARKKAARDNTAPFEPTPVNAIAVAPDGTAWLATPMGISRIERKTMTLEDKAQYLIQVADERHTRMGYIVRCVLDAPGDVEHATINHTDNDGLYTATFGTSQNFRYGATKDPDAKRRANEAFQALKLLFDVTGIKGFPARSVIPSDWPDPNEGFGEAQNLAAQKDDPLWKNIVPRWPKSADGKYYWKCDTSSDEIIGHFFFFATYYDLVCETEAEKAEVRQLVHDLMSHIVDNNWCLVDHDGKPTRWGNWSPEYCNNGGWSDRGVQAVEILSFLNVAYHVTGDQKFLDAAKYLRDEHDYHVNAMNSRATFPPTSVVPWDDNLSFQSYYGLIKYETDPDLKRRYLTALDHNWLFVGQKHDPFYNFTFASLYPDEPAVEHSMPFEDKSKALTDGFQTLFDMPLDLIGWNMYNSQRLDVTLDTRLRQAPGIGWYHNGEALPFQERSQIRINSDPFQIDGGQAGRIEYEGSVFLLPYYMGRYYGFIK